MTRQAPNSDMPGENGTSAPSSELTSEPQTPDLSLGPGNGPSDNELSASDLAYMEAAAQASVEPQVMQDDTIGGLLARAQSRGTRQSTTPEEKRERRLQYNREYAARKREREGKPPSRARASGSATAAASITEFADAVLAPVLMILFDRAFGEMARPTEDEAEGMAAPLARIVLRHIPLPKEMTPDFIDAMAFFTAASFWFTRVSPALKEQSKARKEARATSVTSGRGDGRESVVPTAPTEHTAADTFMGGAS